MNRLFRNPQPVVYAIVLFVMILLVLFSLKAEGSELNFEAGSAMLRGETPAIGLHIRWPDQGPVGTDYEAGFILSGESTHHQDNPNAVTWYGALVDGYGPLHLGLGWAWTNIPYEYACQSTFALLARYQATERVGLSWRHFSSAGSCRPNAGRDYLTLTWRF